MQERTPRTDPNYVVYGHPYQYGQYMALSTITQSHVRGHYTHDCCGIAARICHADGTTARCVVLLARVPYGTMLCSANYGMLRDDANWMTVDEAKASFGVFKNKTYALCWFQNFAYWVDEHAPCEHQTHIWDKERWQRELDADNERIRKNIKELNAKLRAKQDEKGAGHA